MIFVKADQQGHQKEHSWFKGNAVLRFGEVSIFADAFDLFTAELEGGKEQRRLVAEGNVVFVQGEERLSGSKLEMDLNTGKGTFDNPFGYVSPGLFVEGKSLQRIDPRTYTIDDPKFTSCAQPNPRWSFTASSAKIHVGDKIVSKNTLFRVKSAPTPLFFPYFMYPIGHDGRGTGLLFPRFGFGANKGFETGLGFFWAMGRSFDQTFSFDNYSRIGYGVGHEFRYVLGPGSRATFNTYLFKQTKDYLRRPPTGGWEYDVEAKAQQVLPFKFRLNAQAREYSSLGFQERFQESVLYSAARSTNTNVALSRQFGQANFSVVGDRTETFYGEKSSAIQGHLPSIRLRQVNWGIGKTGILLNYDLRAERLQRGDQTSVDEFNRYDVNPDLARPTSLSFLQFTPRVRYRVTRYSASLPVVDGEASRKPTGPALVRRYGELSTEFSGPYFSRIFGGIRGYTDKIKHVIGPEIVYTYRPTLPVEDIARIPRFDGDDRTVGTNEIRYGLVQRLIAKRPSGASGKTAPYEFLSWRIGQTYYGNIEQNPAQCDPAYGSPECAQGAQAQQVSIPRTSPIQSRLKFRPTRAFSTDLSFEYDTAFKALKSASFSTGLNTDRLGIDVGYFKGAQRKPSGEIVREIRSGNATTTFEIVPKRLTLQARADYDFIAKELFSAIANLRYSVQCCGFGIQAYQKGLFGGGKEAWGFKFQLELANIGSVGNSNGADRGGALSGRRR